VARLFSFTTAQCANSGRSPDKVDLAVLLGHIAFGAHGQFVLLGEEGQRLRHAFHQLDFAREDLVRHRGDALQVVLFHGAFGQPQIALAQIAPEVDRAVAVNPGVIDLDFIQNPANLVRSERGMVQVIAELVERLFEIDVVFPERVVGVEDEVLPFRSVSICHSSHRR
jgi:hypothetical protein